MILLESVAIFLIVIAFHEIGHYLWAKGYDRGARMRVFTQANLSVDQKKKTALAGVVMGIAIIFLFSLYLNNAYENGIYSTMIIFILYMIGIRKDLDEMGMF